MDYLTEIIVNALMLHATNGRVSETCWAKGARHKRTGTIWLLLHKVLRQTKLFSCQESRCLWAGGQG